MKRYPGLLARRKALIGRFDAAFKPLGVQVLPHYSRFLTRFERFEERCCDYEKAHQVSVIRLNDGDGVIIDGEKMEIRNDM